MLYHYIASDKEGRLKEADFEADSLQDVLRHLSLQELRPISVKSLRQSRALFQRMGKITLTDKVFLSKYLTLMLRVGTDLLAAINILIADFEKPAMKNFLLEVRENLSRGKQFHVAFAAHPRSFSPVFVSLIKAAESSGNLQRTFELLSASLEKEAELRSKIKSAFIYPAIILSASLGIFIFLTTFALPRIAKVFDQGGIEPPFFSRIVFSVGLFFGDHVLLVMTLLLGLVAFFIYFFFKNRIGRRVAERIVRHIPVIRGVYREAALQRFASTFSSLLRAGLPIVEATKISAGVVGSQEFQYALIRIADEGLAKGLTIGDAFRREVVFPKVLINLVAISEKAGHLEEVLETLSDFYAVSVDAGVKTLISFLEPLLLLFMGLLVGGIAISIVIPIYQLTSQF
ncbi:MAG: type II secretion system F family protein [Patescibacteria group bacterium]